MIQKILLYVAFDVLFTQLDIASDDVAICQPNRRWWP